LGGHSPELDSDAITLLAQMSFQSLPLGHQSISYFEKLKTSRLLWLQDTFCIYMYVGMHVKNYRAGYRFGFDEIPLLSHRKEISFTEQ
jgi:hypothetical protein